MRLTPHLTPPLSMLWPGRWVTVALAGVHATPTASATPSTSATSTAPTTPNAPTTHKTPSIEAPASSVVDRPQRLAASMAGTLAPVGARVARREHAKAASFRLAIRLSDAQLVALLATALSIAFYVWYAQQGLTLAYGDSISHMLIARRVLIGRHPGLAQFGSVWPPLTHILMLPLIWNDDLYRSGFAGALPSMVAYVLSAAYTLRLGRLAFSSRTAGWIAALALMLNPNVLYMQSTPMTEMSLICSAVIAIYYAVSWAHDVRTADLVKCAAATAAGTLIRYDGWALALALTLLLGFIAWRRRGWTYAESHLLLFSILAFAGCAGWLIYNRVIFGNWLDFYDGPYAAATQQLATEKAVQVPTLGDPLTSLNTYGFATIDTAGALLTGVALLGVLGWLIRRRYSLKTLPIVAALVPFFFNWLSLTKGASILESPEIAFNGAHTYFNERYGMMILPAIALFAAWLAARQRPLLVAVFLLVLSYTVSDGFLNTPYSLQDPLHGVTSSGRTQARSVGEWLRGHCQDGDILLSAGALGTAMFYSELPDTEFVTDGDNSEFYAVLAHPEQSASCIAMSPHSGNYDPVWDKLHGREDWRQYFVLRAVIKSVEVYQRVGTVAAPASTTTTQSGGMCCQPASHATPAQAPRRRPIYPRLLG